MLRLVSNSSVLTAARLLGGVATLLSTIILTRNFGAEIAAGFAVCMALAATMATLGLFGFQAFAPILTAEYSKTGQYGHLRGLVLFGGAASLALTATICLTLLAAHHIGLLGWLGFEADWSLLLAASGIGLAITSLAFAAGVLTGFHKQRRAQLPDSLLRPFMVLSLVATVAVAIAQPQLTHVLTIAAGAFVVTSALSVTFLWREMQKIPAAPPQYDLPRWGRMAPSWLGITLVWDNMIELMLLVAAALAGAAEVVLLHICFRYRVLAGFGVRSIYSISQPRIYEAIVGRDEESARSIIGVTNILCLIYGVLVLAFIALFADLLLGVFGPEFRDGKLLLLCVCSLILIRAIFGPGMAVLGVLGAQLQVAIVLGVSLVVAVVMSIVLFPALGILAIGVSYTGANAVSAATLWWLARRKSKLDCAIWAVDFRKAYRLLMDEIAASSIPARFMPRS